MKVIFYTIGADDSDIYEFPDNTTEQELSDAANKWVADNVAGYYEIVDEED